MRTEFLFKYLQYKKVLIEGSADKSNMVKKVLEIWGSTNEVIPIDDDNSVDAPPPNRLLLFIS